MQLASLVAVAVTFSSLTPLSSQLLEVEMPQHSSLLKALYGLLMLLPQSTAFRTLNTRLSTVCNLRDNLNTQSNDRKVSTSESERSEANIAPSQRGSVGPPLLMHRSNAVNTHTAPFSLQELKDARKALAGTPIDHSVLLDEFERVCKVHQEHRQQLIAQMSLQDDKKQSGGESSR